MWALCNYSWNWCKFFKKLLKSGMSLWRKCKRRRGRKTKWLWKHEPSVKALLTFIHATAACGSGSELFSCHQDVYELKNTRSVTEFNSFLILSMSLWRELSTFVSAPLTPCHRATMTTTWHPCCHRDLHPHNTLMSSTCDEHTEARTSIWKKNVYRYVYLFIYLFILD